MGSAEGGAPALKVPPPVVDAHCHLQPGWLLHPMGSVFWLHCWGVPWHLPLQVQFAFMHVLDVVRVGQDAGVPEHV